MPATDHRAATERTLRVAVLAWSAAWLITFAPRLLGPTPWTTSQALTTGLVMAVAVVWIATVVGRFRAGVALVPLLAASAAVQAWATADAGLVANDSVLTAWTDAACVAAGFAYAGRPAWGAIVAIVGAQGVLLAGRGWQSGLLAQAWPTLVEVVGYGLATGFAAAVAAGTLRTASAHADAAQSALLVRRRDAAARAAHRAEGERLARVLHDTVINTLGALRRGVPAATADKARARCVQDLTRLDLLTDASGDSAPGPGGDAPLASLGAATDRDAAPAPHGTGDPALPPLATALATVAMRVGGLLTALCVGLTAAAWILAPAPSSLIALALLGGVLALVAAVGLRQGRIPVPWQVAAALVIATTLVAALPAMDAVSCRALNLVWWAPIGAMVPLIGLTVLTRGLGWPLLGAAGFLAGTLSIYLRSPPVPPECIGTPAAVVAYNIAVVAAIVLFRQRMVLLWEDATRARAEAAQVDIAVAAAAARQQARQARLGGLRATAVPLLQGIGSGDLDLADPEIRRRCGLEEEALRGLLQIDAGNGWLGDDLAAAVLQAHATGRQIRITAAPAVPLPDQTGRPLLRDTVHDAIASLPASGTATLALLPAGEGGGELMLVSDVAPDRALAAADAEPNPPVHGLDVGRETLDGQELLWIRWPA